MNMEKYLPIGTVCLLKDAKKRVMITGYAARGKEIEDRVFDYMGCLYPEGIITTDKTLLFDHEQIDKLYYMGYMDDEWKNVQVKLKQIVANLANDTESSDVSNPTPQSNETTEKDLFASLPNQDFMN